MELIYREMPMDYEFYDTSDAHYGPLNCHREAFREIIGMVQEKPNRFLWHKGDGVDCVTPGDKRFATVSADVRARWRNPQDHADLLISDLEPIRDRILAYLIGNHEYHLINTFNIGQHICDKLQVPYGGVICKFGAVHKKKVMHKFLLWHGRGSLPHGAKDPIQREANRKAALKRKLDRMGHTDCVYQTMGHCFSSDTEILTSRGWKKYTEIEIGESVLTMNMDSGFAEWGHVNKIFIHKDKFKKILTCETKHIDFSVTDGHRIIYKNRGCVFKETYAKDASEKNLLRIPIAASSGLKDIDIKDDVISLMGWLISEGHFRKNGPVQLFQRESNAQVIRNILDGLNIKYSEYKRNHSGRKFFDPITGVEYSSKEDGITFYIPKEESKNKILPYISNKSIPNWLFSISDRQFKIFLAAMIDGDGYKQKCGTGCIYYTSDSCLADDLQSLCISHGWRAKIKKRNGSYEVLISNTKISAIYKRKQKNGKENPWREEVCTDVVWCVSVDNGTVFVRRNGKPCVLGNTHQLVVVEPTAGHEIMLTDNRRELKQERRVMTKQNAKYIPPECRWYGCSGSFLRLYSKPGIGAIGYGEIAGFEPADIGCLKGTVQGGQLVHVEKVSL